MVCKERGFVCEKKGYRLVLEAWNLEGERSKATYLRAAADGMRAEMVRMS
jgi:hypothetical protein